MFYQVKLVSRTESSEITVVDFLQVGCPSCTNKWHQSKLKQSMKIT